MRDKNRVISSQNIKKSRLEGDVSNILMQNFHFLIEKVDDILFAKGELYLRKRVIDEWDVIKNNFKEKIVVFLDKGVYEKQSKMQVVSYIETELLFLSKKIKNEVDESVVEKEDEINRCFLKEKNVVDYGVFIKFFMEEIIDFRKDMESRLINDLFLEISEKWESEYKEKLDKIFNLLEEKDMVYGEIELEEKNKNSGMKEIFKKEFENNKSAMNDNGDLFDNSGKVEIKSALSFMSEIEQIQCKEDIGERGFDSFKKILKDKSMPSENLHLLKTITDIFEKFIEDDYLSNQEKVLIYRLQFPTIKTSFIDSDLINGGDPIVVEALEKIVKNIKLVNEDEINHFKEIEKYINDFVNNDFSDKRSEEVKSMWFHLRKRFDKKESRIKILEKRNEQKEKGEEAHLKAKKYSQARVDSVFNELPKNVITSDLNQKVFSALYLLSVKGMDKKSNDMFVSLNNFMNHLLKDKNKEKIKKSANEMCKILEEEFPEQVKDMQNSLKNFILDNIRKEKIDFENKKNKVIFKNEVAQSKKIDFESKEYKVIERAKINDWFRIKSDKKYKNCKLLLKLNNDKKFIFVGSDGAKNFELSLYDFYSLLRGKECQKIEENDMLFG